MNNLFFTGASGFVGQNLIRYLANFKITTYKRGEEFNLSGIDVVIHLAGKAHDLKNVSKPEEYYEVNFELTKSVYNAFLISDAKKFIFLSSVKAAADEIDEELKEDIVATPKTHYGKSKRMAEEYILANLPENKEVYILRPCIIHGPGNKGNLNLLYQIVKKGLPWPLGLFENKRSFLSIGNLCFVIRGLIEKNAPNGVYNVADDKAISTNELIAVIAKVLNLKTRIWNISTSLINVFAILGTVFNLPLNKERLKKLTESYVVSNAKIKQVLEIDKMPILTEEGLVITIQSFKQSC